MSAREFMAQLFGKSASERMFAGCLAVREDYDVNLELPEAGEVDRADRQSANDEEGSADLDGSFAKPEKMVSWTSASTFEGISSASDDPPTPPEVPELSSPAVRVADRWAVSLKRSRAVPLGLEVTELDGVLVVVAVSDGATVQQHNLGNPLRAVKRHDVIADVNGSGPEPSEVIDVLKNPTTKDLKFVFERPAVWTLSVRKSNVLLGTYLEQNARPKHLTVKTNFWLQMREDAEPELTEVPGAVAIQKGACVVQVNNETMDGPAMLKELESSKAGTLTFWQRERHKNAPSRQSAFRFP